MTEPSADSEPDTEPDGTPDDVPKTPAESAPTPQAASRPPAGESEREAEATIRSISRLEESN